MPADTVSTPSVVTISPRWTATPLSSRATTSPTGHEQSVNAAFTPRMISLTVTTLSPLTSNVGHEAMGSVSRVMFTPTISSLMVTAPSALQSPGQVPASAALATRAEGDATATITEKRVRLAQRSKHFMDVSFHGYVVRKPAKTRRPGSGEPSFCS